MSSRNSLRFATVFVFIVIAASSSSVYGGDTIHIHNVQPKASVCRRDFVLVKVPIFVDGIQIREYVGVGAQFSPTLESKKNHVKETALTASDPPDCCSTVGNKIAGGAVLVYCGGCSFAVKANNAKAAGASAILIINNDTDILKMVCEDDADTNINFPAAMLPLDAGEELKALLSNPSTATVSVQLYSHRLPSVGVTEVFPWIMAAGTILCAYYWSSWTVMEAALEQDTLKNHHDRVLAEAADKLLRSQHKIANCEHIIDSLEEMMDNYDGQVNELENLCTKELLKSKEIEAELDVLKSRHEKALTEADEEKQVLRNEIETYTQTIKAVKEMVDASAELVKLREAERDTAIKISRDLTEVNADFFLTVPSSEILKAASQPDQSSQLLCEGELGNIYKAVLYHTEVTLRFIPEERLLALENEVKMLSKFRHPNLATLIGVCPETSTLVYEHLPNGSLEDRLRCKGNSRPLPWQTRIRIAVELCSVLIFLHSNGVTHGALRPSCVLLDSSFTCKIIDFRFFHKGNDESSPTSSNYIGEYTDPEFLQTREASPSSDIYSFGLMLLELLTGKPGFSVIQEMKSCLDQDSLNSLLDTSAGEWSHILAQQLAHLGLRCSNADSKSRPDLPSDAWKVLEPMRRSCGSAISSRVGEPPPYFICPIILDVMENPHVAADGYTYEAEVLKMWFERGHNTSPMTNLPLDNTNLVPNRALHSAIQEWRQLQQQ